MTRRRSCELLSPLPLRLFVFDSSSSSSCSSTMTPTEVLVPPRGDNPIMKDPLFYQYFAEPRDGDDAGGGLRLFPEPHSVE